MRSARIIPILAAFLSWLVSYPIEAATGPVMWGAGHKVDARDFDQPFTKIAAGESHTIALKADGTVVVWGGNSDGEGLVPEGLNGVVAIDAGLQYSMALTVGGRVEAWGSNAHGKATVPEAARSGVMAIAAGSEHAVALKEDGTVLAWGRNDAGQTTVPPGLAGVVAIAAGLEHSVALKDDGTVVVWGNSWGSMPDGLSGVTAIAAGYHHTLVLKDDGTVASWGLYLEPAPEDLTDVTAIAVGRDHMVALRSNGTVVAWGRNFYGQLDVPEDLVDVVAIAATDHTVALKANGTVVAWGANGSGQALDNERLAGLVDVVFADGHTVGLKRDGTVITWGLDDKPAVPEGLSGVVAIAATTYNGAALKNDGTVVVWHREHGLQEEELTGVVAIAAGRDHIAALKNDGTVTTWGNVSVIPEGVSDVVKIAVGTAHTLALKSNGQVLGWLTDGEEIYFPPGGVSGAIAIAAGSDHSLAVKVDGTVQAWGGGSYGQTAVPHDLTGVVSVAGTRYYSVALKADGTAVLWGDADEELLSIQDLSGITKIFAANNRIGAFVPVSVWNPEPSPSAPTVAVDPVYELQTTGNLMARRSAPTATRLVDGRVLLVGGRVSTAPGVVAEAEVYAPASGTWSPAGSLTNARSRHTATLLPNGKVLVVGGAVPPSTTLSSAELYDPASNTWTTVEPLTTPRYDHTATCLADGRVLVAGGRGQSGVLSSAEIYDPATSTWSTTTPMPKARTLHSAALLPDGKVLLAAGSGTGADSAHVYDPASNSWATTGSPALTGRTQQTLTSLPDGRVLLAGGSIFDDFGETLPVLAEIYNPATGEWASAGNLIVGRSSAAAALTDDGKVLLTGGYDPAAELSADAQLYNPQTNSWTAVPPLPAARSLHTATALTDGSVLIAGGAVDGGVLQTIRYTASLGALSVPEGAIGGITGTFADAQGEATVTLSATLGTVVRTGPGTWSWSSPASVDGPSSRLVTIIATDDQNERGAASFRFNVTNVPPVPTISIASDIIEVRTEVDFTFSVTDPSAADSEARIEGEVDFGNLQIPMPLLMSGESSTVTHIYYEAGTYEVTYRAIDKDGGEAVTTRTITVVDTTPPDLTLYYGPSEITEDNYAYFGVGADEPVLFTYSLDGGPAILLEEEAAEWAWLNLNDLAPGLHTLAVVATDLAGNTTPAPVVRTWVVVGNTPGTIGFNATASEVRPVDASGQPSVVTVPVVRAGGANGEVAVLVSASQPATVPKGFAKYVYGVDYEFVSGADGVTMVTFGHGQAMATVNVRLKAPALSKKGQFKLALGQPTGGADLGIASTTITVNARDKSAPVITISSPTKGSLTAAFDVTGTVKEADELTSFSVKLNGEVLQLVNDPVANFQPSTAVSFSVTDVEPENGPNTLVIEAIDASGNKATVTRTLNYVNSSLANRAGVYSALIRPIESTDLDLVGLVNVTVTSTGAFTGKVTLSEMAVTFTGILKNDGSARFKPALKSSFDLIDRKEGYNYLGAVMLSVDENKTLTGTLNTEATEGTTVATFSARHSAYTSANLVPAGYLNQPGGGTPTKGGYTVVFPSKAQTPEMDHSMYPQGDGYAALTLTNNGNLRLVGFLADGTKYTGANRLRADGSVALFTALYRKMGGFGGELEFAPQSNSDVAGADFTWVRPAQRRAGYYPGGWPEGVRVDAVGAKYAAPASLDFGQGGANPIEGNTWLVFADGLLGDTLQHVVSIDPANGAVKVIPAGTTAYTFKLAPATGIFNGTFIHSSGSKEPFGGILLNKGANKGGYGYFLSAPPLKYGVYGQGGGVSLQARQP